MQARSIGPLLDGRDVIAEAPSGPDEDVADARPIVGYAGVRRSVLRREKVQRALQVAKAKAANHSTQLSGSVLTRLLSRQQHLW